MTCANCGHVNAPVQDFCTNCGARLVRQTAEPGTNVSLIVLGVAGGVCATIVLYISGWLAFTIKGPEGAATYAPFVIWAIEGAGVLAGSVYLLTGSARRRLSPRSRTILFGMAFVMLGGMTLCGILSAGILNTHS